MEDKKTRVAAFHRQTILQAAKALFQEKGYADTTMDQISAKAEYSKRTVYSYFKSKEELQEHIVLEGFRALLGVLQEAAKKETFLESYETVCGGMLAEYEKEPYQFRSALEFRNKPADFENPVPVIQEIYQVGEDINRELSGILRRGMEEGIVRPNIQPQKTGLVFWAAMSGVLAFAFDKEVYLKKKFQQDTDAFLRDAMQQLLGMVVDRHAQA